MVWRWILRGMGIALLTFCVAAWVGSYYEQLCIIDAIAPNNCWTLELHWGRIDLGRGNYGPAVPVGWTYGFGHEPAQRNPIGVPFFWERKAGLRLYIPTLLSILLLGFVWWKTRTKYNGKGFPVKVGPKATKAQASPNIP
jgi:hypothetical protein